MANNRIARVKDVKVTLESGEEFSTAEVEIRDHWIRVRGADEESWIPRERVAKIR